MRLFLACALIALSLTGHQAAAAAPADQQAVAPVGQTQTETQAYLAKLDQTLALAGKGQYGKLKRGAADDLQSARERIASALAGRTTFVGLPANDQLKIQNAEDAIAAILRNKDKDRMVCTREAKTGTRFSTTECMTVAQREARASSAAEATGTVQRETCVPGETSTCK
jgi:hypothetical protein